MKKLSTVIIAALFLAACNSGLGNKEEAPAVTAPAPLPTTNVVNNNAATQPAAGANAVALNPAHGQPGHTCDLPEGAPLNSAPVQGTALPAAGSVMPTAPATASPIAGKRLNPAHGQPGHDCAVPVGQPLN